MTPPALAQLFAPVLMRSPTTPVPPASRVARPSPSHNAMAVELLIRVTVDDLIKSALLFVVKCVCVCFLFSCVCVYAYSFVSVLCQDCCACLRLSLCVYARVCVCVCEPHTASNHTNYREDTPSSVHSALSLPTHTELIRLITYWLHHRPLIRR